MRYVDKSGHSQKSPVNILISNTKSRIRDMKKEPPKPVMEEAPILDLTPIPTINSLSLNMKSGEIIAYMSDSTYKAYKVDEQYLGSVSRELISETLENYQITSESMDITASAAINASSASVAKLIAAAEGKNNLISAQFDVEFVDTASTVLANAFLMDPRAARKEGSTFFKKILKQLLHQVDDQLQPTEEEKD